MSQTFPKVSPADLALRVPPKPVTRLNRKTIFILSMTGLVGLFGIFYYGLSQSMKTKADKSEEIYSTEGRNAANGDVLNLPKTYGDVKPGEKPAQPSQQQPAQRQVTPAAVPQLGPPLPGDWGKAMLATGHGAAAGTASAGNAERERAEAEKRRKAEEEAEAALKSPLFPRDVKPGAVGSGAGAVPGSAGAPPAERLSQLLEQKAAAQAAADRLRAQAVGPQHPPGPPQPLAADRPILGRSTWQGP